MGKFRKIVLNADRTYQSSTGPVHVPTNRIAKWIEHFKAQKAKGIKIPVPWGHQPDAAPVNAGNVKEEEFLKSRFNATYLDDLETTAAGEFVMIAEIPPGLALDDKGNLVDPVSHTLIGECSLAARDWTDGDGVLWEDSIRHIALTPLPVVHGTKGFEPSRLAQVDRGELRLSLSFLATKEEPPPANGDGTPPPPGDKKKEGEEPPDKEKEKPEEEEATKSGDFTVDRATELLKNFDIVVSEAKDAEEFVTHLCIALDALVGQLADEQEQEYHEEPIPTMLSLAGKTTFALASRLRRLKKIIERRKAMPEPKPPETPPTPPKPAGPVLLSLADHADPIVKALGEQMALDGAAKRETRIKALEARGLPPTVAKELREESAGVHLSLLDGKVVPPAIDKKLSQLEESLPARDPLTQNLSLREVPPPEENTSDKEMKEEAKKRGAALSVKTPLRPNRANRQAS